MLSYIQEARKCFYFGKIYEVVRIAKKEEKMKKKKDQKKKVKKEKKPGYLKEVKNEMKNVTFPSSKEVVKYTIATIVIVAFLVAFFLCVSAILSWIKGAI